MHSYLVLHIGGYQENHERFISKVNLGTEVLPLLNFTVVVSNLLPLWLGFFRREDQGQDLAEYCLIVAVIALLGMSLFMNISGGLQGLWGSAGNAFTAANSNASTGATAGAGHINGDAGQ